MPINSDDSWKLRCAARGLALAWSMALALAGSATAWPLSNQQRATLEASMVPGASKDALDAGMLLATELGGKRDLRVLDYLIDKNALRNIGSFSIGLERSLWKSGLLVSAEFEAKIVQHFDDREIAVAMLQYLEKHESPELFNLLYKDAMALASHRASRRKHCRAQILELVPHQSAVGGTVLLMGRPHSAIAAPVEVPRYHYPGQNVSLKWRYVCMPGAKDIPINDLDGLPQKGPHFGPREHISVHKIGNTRISGVEDQLGKIFRDLSLMPSPDWTLVGGQPALLHFPTLSARSEKYTVATYAHWFKSRGALPPTDDVMLLLKEIESYGKASLLSRFDWEIAGALLHALPPPQAKDETAYVVSWLEKALEVDDPSHRQEYLTKVIPLLGPVVSRAQIDLAPLKTKIFERVPYTQVAALTELFKRVEEDNQNLAKPDADSLTRAMMSSTNAEYMIATMLTGGANPNELPKKYSDPAFVLAARGHDRIVKLLLSRGADVNLRSRSGMTALHSAVGRDTGLPERDELVKLLISRGANVDAVTDIGSTPLHHATGSPKTIKLLLRAGAKVDAVDSMGRTPLFGTVISGNIEAALVLLEAGANPNQLDHQGLSPYSDSLTRLQPKMTELLAKFGGHTTVVQGAKRAFEKAIGHAILWLFSWGR